jgi:cytochrome c-type biogenesis protein CcmF
MIPEIGHLSLWLALGVSLVLGVMPLTGAQTRNVQWMLLSRPAAYVLFALVALAFLCLVASFVRHDFSVLNVASNSNSALPLAYRIAASWGSHEGSLLLWLLMLTGWTVAVALFSEHLPQPVLARTLSVMGLVAVGFLLFLLLTSNPFDRLFPVPVDGRDLNPLLQDPGMVFHPPLLYMGYVGFSVAFAFAISALIGGNLDTTWARWTRPWTTLAWMFLTVGIALGSWWAYYELGWGGWWFWDPVENASFMPWLIGTALIHSLAVTEKRGSFKSWTVLLAIVAFSLSLLGTFLVRSGVLSSVHAFATDPRRGLFILMFLAIAVGASLVLYAWRAPKVGLGASFALVSRETALLGNNVMLVVAAAAVLLGTLYPLLLDALGLGKISVGTPYFDAVFLPLMAPTLFLMGIGPIMRWKQAEIADVARRLRWAVVVTVLAALGTGLLAGRVSLVATAGFSMAFWVLASVATDVWDKVHRPGQGLGGVARRTRQLPRAFLGMVVAHFGVAAFCFGVTMVKTYELERDVKMNVGDSTTVNGYTFTFRGAIPVEGPNYSAMRGLVEVTRGGERVTDMRPEKRVYRVQSNPMTEAAISPGFTRDLYVSLGEPVEGNGAWIVRVYVKPFIDWIWGGCLVMALGGLLAATDRRYRQGVRAKVAEPAVSAGAAA